MSLAKIHNEMKIHQVRMNILILGIRCPLCLGKISDKAIHTFSLTLVRKKIQRTDPNRDSHSETHCQDGSWCVTLSFPLHLSKPLMIFNQESQWQFPEL